MALSLESQPSAEIVSLTLAVWYDTLRRRQHWDADTVAPRLRAGFAELCATARRWPVPADLLTAMPRLATPASKPLRLPTDSLRRCEARALAEIAKTLQIPLPPSLEKAHEA